MHILVLNCGSSSVKFAVLDPQSREVALSGLFERVGSPEATATLKSGGEKRVQPLAGGAYTDAFALIRQELTRLGLDTGLGAVGHRVVHGGERFNQPVRINEEVLAGIRECIPLAPLHNPANVAGIEAALEAFPQLPQVAVFDTAFHQTMPPRAYRYAVPEAWYSEHGVRRYGFHGTSHFYVANEAAALLGRPLAELKLVTAHLGNGCSLAAIGGGRSVDTTMGLTPLEGLVMGTRSGNVDAGLLDYVARQTGQTLEQINAALNKQSGLLGLSGFSNDMRELEASDEPRARLALEVFVYQLAKQIASMGVALGGIDALVFTGGIGENSDWAREKALGLLSWLGFELDSERNAATVRGVNGVITTSDSRLPALVIGTNEELVIAQQTFALL